MNATRTRLDPKQRKADILTAAGRVAMRVGWHAVTIQATAAEVPCSPGLVSAYFKTVGKLRADLMREAIKQKQSEIVADGLAMRCPIAHKAPPELIAAARAILATR